MIETLIGTLFGGIFRRQFERFGFVGHVFICCSREDRIMTTGLKANTIK